ncbi:hypothetical protein CLV72_102189 [Allonocardiopsis opalescens]|uniref:Uncharacterized protein n=1 Tax=Allonocardiopsis opalescens TaxID=1144618 RepID=A0A2T0Q9L0_9ACTN|nr:hypothetical protein CLV72_102189 [Allonocardiopsis opalescens]
MRPPVFFISGPARPTTASARPRGGARPAAPAGSAPARVRSCPRAPRPVPRPREAVPAPGTPFAVQFALYQEVTE